MLIGEYQHNIDLKGRIFIPAKLREDLGESFVIAKSMDTCLSIYSIEEWKAFEAEIKKRPYNKARKLIKFYHGNAAPGETDKQGRVVIPQNLREYAKLEKEVTIVGAMDHIEIWDKATRDEDMASISREEIISLMEEFETY